MTAKNTPAETTSAKVACACQNYEIEIWTGEVPEGADPGEYVEYKGTGCTQTTRRVFAPGHDAKLKGLLIEAGATGAGVRVGDMVRNAEGVANSYGFETQVLSGIKRMQAKMAARAEKKAAKEAKTHALAQKVADKANKVVTEAKAAKAAKRAAKASALVMPVKIKVGRWTYEAIINPADNSAAFTSANGEAKTVDEGKYKLVDAK